LCSRTSCSVKPGPDFSMIPLPFPGTFASNPSVCHLHKYSDLRLCCQRTDMGTRINQPWPWDGFKTILTWTPATQLARP
jgi:hypothetical protein